MTTKVILSEKGGYRLQDNSKDFLHKCEEINTELVTNGFDCLDWECDPNYLQSFEYGGLHDESIDLIVESSNSLRSCAYTDDRKFSESLLTTHTTLWGRKLSEDGDVVKMRPRRVSKRRQKRMRKQMKKRGKNSDLYTDDEAQMLRDMLEEATVISSDISIKLGDLTVTEDSLKTLLDDGWIDDNIISFMYEYLTYSQVIPTLAKRLLYVGDTLIRQSVMLLLPTFSFLLANYSNPSGLKDVLPDLSKSSFIFMPVNDNQDFDETEGGSHWSLLLLCPKDQVAIIYDSLYGANGTESIRLIKSASALLGIEFGVETDRYTPQQINHSDCGVIVSAITAVLVDRIINVQPNTQINLSMKNITISALDSRVFMLGTIVKLMRLETGK